MSLKKLLIISPHFPPVNAADMHRTRMYLPYLEGNGWEPTVVHVRPELIDMPMDELLCADIPDNLETHAISARSAALSRLLQSKTMAKRCFRSYRKTIDRLLAQQHFDLVLFSTTAFSLFRLGPRWLKRYGVPYLIDLQDPWINPFYANNPEVPRPGGQLRYWFSSREAIKHEPMVFNQAAGIITVSPTYREDILKRYPDIRADQLMALPFGASRRDFALLQKHDISQDIFNPDDGFIHLVYVGRGGDDLSAALRLLFSGFAEFKRSKAETANRVRFHFVGTSYAPGGRERETIRPIAESLGVGDAVCEYPRRIPYFSALKCLQQSAAIIMPLSADPGYNPSKLYTNLLSGRPVFAVAKRGSVVAENLKQAGPMVHLLQYQDNTKASTDELIQWWQQAVKRLTQSPPDYSGAEFEAEHLAGELCQFMSECLQDTPSNRPEY